MKTSELLMYFTLAAAPMGIPATYGYNNKEACVEHMNDAITDPKPTSIMSTAKTVGSVPFRAGCWFSGGLKS